MAKKNRLSYFWTSLMCHCQTSVTCRYIHGWQIHAVVRHERCPYHTILTCQVSNTTYTSITSMGKPAVPSWGNANIMSWMHDINYFWSATLAYKWCTIIAVPLGELNVWHSGHLRWPLSCLSPKLPYALKVGNRISIQPSPACPKAHSHRVFTEPYWIVSSKPLWGDNNRNRG